MLTVVTPPTSLVVSYPELEAHLNLEGITADEAIVTEFLRTATDELDGPNGWLGRSLCTQTLELTLDAFPGSSIELPLPPLASVTSVKYVDSTGSLQTFAATEYAVWGVGGLLPGHVAPVWGKSWPGTREQPDAIVIRYVAGYGDGLQVPVGIRQALKERVAQMYVARGDAPYMPAPLDLERQLARYRVWSM